MRIEYPKVAGIDENGLGPKLGPLVVTGALFECAPGYEPDMFFESLAEGAGAAGRIGDSKAVMGFKNMGPGEEIVLAFARIIAIQRGEPSPSTSHGIVRLLCGFDPAKVARGCPRGISLCMGADEPLPLFGGSLDRSEALSELISASLASRGIRMAAALSNPLCPAQYNAAFAGMARPSKALLDLSLFESTIRALSRALPGEGLYICGKVMGLSRYSSHMSLIDEFPLARLEEYRAQSSYDLQGLGEVRFVLDGDAAHAPVAIASMIGKYIRELFMRNINGFFKARIPGLEGASGYSDKATAELVRRATPVLAAEGIPDSCFLRER